ncbi:uncharacterized protein LOC143355704 [Halictus rubicundus]|uniref:uncharacterized protein LOC143355704 n=1 Tax=Halictus rubicundus TaxID=77578 RepID=UPI004036DDE0
MLHDPRSKLDRIEGCSGPFHRGNNGARRRRAGIWFPRKNRRTSGDYCPVVARYRCLLIQNGYRSSISHPGRRGRSAERGWLGKRRAHDLDEDCTASMTLDPGNREPVIQSELPLTLHERATPSDSCDSDAPTALFL